MKQILLTTIILLGCAEEDITPQISAKKLNNKIEQLTSTISLLTLMSTNVHDEPFDDLYLIVFSNHLYYNIDEKGLTNISPKIVSSYILLQMKQGTAYDNISRNIIKEYSKGRFETTTIIDPILTN